MAFAVWLGLVTSVWPRAHSALYLHQSHLPVAVPQYISGRTSYLHVRLAFHPYPQLIPQFCNTGEFRASTDFHIRFTLAMDSSRGFGSHHRHSRPVQTRFPCGSPSLATVNLSLTLARERGGRDDDALAGSFYKRHAISPKSLVGQWPLTAGEYVVSGSLSSPLRGAFHLSLTVLVHYRSLKVLSLGGWSPRFPQTHRGSWYSGIQPGAVRLALRDSHPLRWRFPTPSSRQTLPVYVGPYNPHGSSCEEPQVWARPVSLATTPGISFDFFSSGY